MEQAFSDKVIPDFLVPITEILAKEMWEYKYKKTYKIRSICL